MKIFKLIRNIFNTELDRKTKISIISSVILWGFIIAILFHAAMGYIFHAKSFYCTFLFHQADAYGDFFKQLKVAKHIDPSSSIRTLEGIYLPFSYIILYPFTFIDKGDPSLSKTAYYTYALIFLLYFMWYVYINLKSINKYSIRLKHFFVFSFLTYPFLFAIDRGNLEMYSFIFISLFVCLYQNRQILGSLIPLALSIAMKGISIVFIVLLINNKKYKEIVFLLFMVISFSITSFLAFTGGILENLIGIVSRTKIYTMDYMFNNWGLGYNSTLYGLIKITLYQIFPKFFNSLNNIKLLYSIYLPCAGFIFLCILAYILFIEKTFWKKMSLIIISLILLPGMSGDYRLLYLFIPLFLFINQQGKDKHDMLYAVLFASLLIPKNYFFFHDKYFFSQAVSISSIFNPLIMLFFVFLIMKDSKRIKE